MPRHILMPAVSAAQAEAKDDCQSLSRNGSRKKKHVAFCAGEAPLRQMTVLPLGLPNRSDHVERGILFSDAIARFFSFDLVYIALLLQRHDPLCLVHGQLLGYHRLESVPQPLRIACTFHQDVIQSGQLEYSNPSPVGNDVFYAHALAFPTPHRDECQNTTRHSHFILFAGYMFPRKGGVTDHVLSKIRGGFYLSAESMVRSMLAAPWQYPRKSKEKKR